MLCNRAGYISFNLKNCTFRVKQEREEICWFPFELTNHRSRKYVKVHNR